MESDRNRTITDAEVAIKITEEVALVSNMASSFLLSGGSLRITIAEAVEDAYNILDQVIKVRDQRLELSRQREMKRRRGY